jgi:hypothetical protein
MCNVIIIAGVHFYLQQMYVTTNKIFRISHIVVGISVYSSRCCLRLIEMELFLVMSSVSVVPRRGKMRLVTGQRLVLVICLMKR